MITTVYLNLEDDVAKIVARIKKVRGSEIVLVCPKRCFLFSDKMNLVLLKKQTDFLQKKISVLTMDDKGQNFAKDAGFEIKVFPKNNFKPTGVSDIQVQRTHVKNVEPLTPAENQLSKAVKDVSNFVSGLVMKKEAPVESLSSIDKPTVLKTQNKSPQALSLKQGIPPTLKKSSKSYFRIFSLITLLTVILSLVLFFLVLPEAQVIIYPKSEKLIRDFDISLDSTAKKYDVASLVLPSVKISETLTQSNKFQSKGKKDVGNKASGYIKIYNFTGQILNLKSETTTLNVSGKTYKLVNDALQIKPIKYKNAKTKEIDETSLSEPVAIVASSGGEDFNLPAGLRMEISNTVFGSRPQVLYAKTSDPITGGYTRYLSIVSEADISSARDQLGAEILSIIKQKLTDSGLELLDNGYRIEVVDFSTDKAVNTESPSFNAKLLAKISGLAFSKNDFNVLVKERLSQGISESKELNLDEHTEIVRQLKNIDLNLFNASLAVHLETQAFSKIKVDEFFEKLKGQSVKNANEVLLADENIDKAEVTLSPSWQKTFPLIKNKINIIINK
jgi:hypothetical protein